MSTLLRSLIADVEVDRDRAMAAADLPSATDAVRQFYAACHLRAPRILIARSLSHYQETVKSPDAETYNAILFLLVVAAIVGLMVVIVIIEAIKKIGFNLWVDPDASITWGLLTFGLVLGLSPIIFLLYARRHPSFRKTSASMLGLLRAACIDSGCSVRAIPDRIKVDDRHDHESLCLRFGALTGLSPMLPHLQKLDDGLTQLEQLSSQKKARLPLVLRHAIALRSVTRGVFLTDGIAVILPLVDAELTPRQRRKRMADAVEEPDPKIRETEMRRLSLEHTVNRVKLRPVQSDETGDLYRIGVSTAPACFVRVRDTVRGGDGLPLVHWLSVPSYITTAREGVAWSYQLAAHEYAPLVRE